MLIVNSGGKSEQRRFKKAAKMNRQFNSKGVVVMVEESRDDSIAPSRESLRGKAALCCHGRLGTHAEIRMGKAAPGLGE